MEDNVKPRFDGKNLLGFANMHRLLGNKTLMFDVDRIYAKLDLSMQKEDELFPEYIIINTKVIFTALFEYKYKHTTSTLESLNKYNANSMARLQMARMLKCRLFIVFGTNGKQPFKFVEIDTESGDIKNENILKYDETNNDLIKDIWRNFWINTLNIEI
jgi:hypothetical protein